MSGITTKAVFATVVLFMASFLVNAQPAFPQDAALPASEAFTENTEISLPRIERGALIRAEFAQHVDWSHVAKGTVLEGTFSSSVYASEQAALPAGTKLRVSISSSEKVRDRQGFWKNAGHALLRAFNPLENAEAPQYHVTLSSAELQKPSGEWATIEASVVRAGASVIVSPREKGADSSRAETVAAEHAPRAKNKPAQILLLQLDKDLSLPSRRSVLSLQLQSPAIDRKARAYLLTRLSASQSLDGDKFQAQLAEPVRFGDREFQSGSLLEGTVVRRTPPRIFSRAGKLYLRMDRIIAQTGEALDVSGTLSSAETDKQTRFDLDEEGTLRGRKPGFRNGLVDLGLDYAVGKASDDLAETPIRAFGASMSGAAVANAARYVGLAGAVTFLVTRRGRDVYLPKYAEIEIEFGRVNQTVAASSVP